MEKIKKTYLFRILKPYLMWAKPFYLKLKKMEYKRLKIVIFLMNVKSILKFPKKDIFSLILSGVNLLETYENDYFNCDKEKFKKELSYFNFSNNKQISRALFEVIDINRENDFPNEYDNEKLYVFNFTDINTYIKLYYQVPLNCENYFVTYKDQILKNQFIVPKYQTNKFTIATACYNNEKYLDKYFRSIVKQKYSFKKYIDLIIVDDGSTDKSLDIMLAWQKKFPDNIKVISKENSGQADSRNVALEHVTNEWVTFIDSDDFISRNYFMEINKGINHRRGCNIFSGCLSTYTEETNTSSRVHYSNNNAKGAFSCYNMNEAVNSPKLSVSTSILNMKIITKENIRFRDIKPAFEDTDFMIQYYMANENDYISYCKRCDYYYRKAVNSTSTTANIMENELYYTNFLVKGVIPTIASLDKIHDSIPFYIQKIYAETTQWVIRSHYNRSFEFDSIISIEERSKMFDGYIELYSHFDAEILEFIKTTFLPEISTGIFSSFMPKIADEALKHKAVFLKKAKDKYVIQIFTNSNDISINILGEIHQLSDFEYVEYQNELLTRNFIKTYNVYIPCAPYDILYLEINGSKIPLEIPENAMFYDNKLNVDSTYLIMDRMDCAGDNGEIFYQKMMDSKYDFKNIYFGLKRDSSDWNRLKKRGFNLVEYDSTDYLDLYLKADCIISSHADMYIINYKNIRKINPNIRFVFLQHGVMMGDMSTWLLPKQLDLIVTTGDMETNQLSSLFSNEIVNTGLTRLDRNLSTDSKDILYLPGWSAHLNNLNEDQFIESSKYKDISFIMNNKNLQEYLQANNIKIHIKLHPNLAKKYNFKKYNTDCIKVSEESYDFLFSNTNFIITDFSSAFIDKFINGCKVMFLQSNADEYYKKQVIRPLNNYKYYGPIFTDREKFVDAIIDTSIVEWEVFDIFRESNFGKNTHNHSELLIEEILKL